MAWDDNSAAPEASNGQMWVVEVETSGALAAAPRVLRCWFHGEDLAVRDDQGVLLWLNVGPYTAYQDGGRGLAEAREDAFDEVMFRHPVPEAAALASLQSALAWLGTREPNSPAEEPTKYLGLSARTTRLSSEPFDDIQIVTDEATGRVLQIMATHHVHGQSGVRVTNAALHPVSDEAFEVLESDRT